VVVRDGAEVLPPGTPLAEPDPEVVRTFAATSPLLLLQCGESGFYGAWDTLLTAARKLASDGVALVFVGDGAQRAEIEAAAAGAGNIRFLDFFPAAKIPSVLAAADAHIINRETRAGRRGRAQQNVRNPGGGKNRSSRSRRKKRMLVTLGMRAGSRFLADPDKPRMWFRCSLRSRRRAKTEIHGEAARAASPDYDRVKELQNLWKFSITSRPLNHTRRTCQRDARETYWTGKKVFVTGGASFIGSTLTDQLLTRGVAKVSHCRRSDQRPHQQHSAASRQRQRLIFMQGDLREPGVTRDAMQGMDICLSSAADHGGRGYVDLHQAGPASNFFLDGLVFAEALKAKVKKVVFASSGCVYRIFCSPTRSKNFI